MSEYLNSIPKDDLGLLKHKLKEFPPSIVQKTRMGRFAPYPLLFIPPKGYRIIDPSSDPVLTDDMIMWDGSLLNWFPLRFTHGYVGKKVSELVKMNGDTKSLKELGNIGIAEKIIPNFDIPLNDMVSYIEYILRWRIEDGHIYTSCQKVDINDYIQNTSCMGIKIKDKILYNSIEYMVIYIHKDTAIIYDGIDTIEIIQINEIQNAKL